MSDTSTLYNTPSLFCETGHCRICHIETPIKDGYCIMCLPWCLDCGTSGDDFKHCARGLCRPCYRRWRYIENHEDEKAYAIQYNRDNPEYRKQWEDDNKEHRSRYFAQYSKKNRDKLNALSRKWSRENPDKVKAKRDRYNAKHPDRVREQRRASKVRHKDRVNKENVERYHRVGGYGYRRNLDALLERQNYTCALKSTPDCMSHNGDLKRLERSKIHVDHIWPLSRKNEYDGDINSIENLQATCFCCNILKSDSTS